MKNTKLLQDLELELEKHIKRQKQILEELQHTELTEGLEECYLSKLAHSGYDDKRWELETKISILKNGGFYDFTYLKSLKNEEIDLNSKIIEGKYGNCWLSNGIFISFPNFRSKKYSKLFEVLNDIFVPDNENKDYKIVDYMTALSSRNRCLNIENKILVQQELTKIIDKIEAEHYFKKGFEIVEVSQPAWVEYNKESHQSYVFVSDINYAL